MDAFKINKILFSNFLLCFIIFVGCNIRDEARDVVQEVTQEVVPYAIHDAIQEGLTPFQDDISDLTEQFAYLNSIITSLTEERIRLDAENIELKYSNANLMIRNEYLENQKYVLEIANRGYVAVIENLGNEVRIQTERASQKEAELERFKNINMFLAMSIILNLLFGIILIINKLKHESIYLLIKNKIFNDKCLVYDDTKKDDK